MTLLKYKTSIFLSFSSLGGLLFLIYLKWPKKKFVQTLQTETRPRITEVLFFPDAGLACKRYLYCRPDIRCQRQQCKYLHRETSLSKLCGYLEMARNSLDICIFLFTSKPISESLYKVQRRGVKVRILVDAAMAKAEEIRVTQLKRNGIEVLEAVSSNLMHHKFALMDGWLLATGSFNWTAQATLGNCDNVIVTSDPDIVKPFLKVYDELWQQFSQAKVK